MEQNKVQELHDVVIRFSGDSGDGMHLVLFHVVCLLVLS